MLFYVDITEEWDSACLVLCKRHDGTGMGKQCFDQ